jgi:hypothetical protein
MTSSPPEPGLFADGPARDARFEVKDRWIECTNLPVDDPAHLLEFFHRQMNEEVTSIACFSRASVPMKRATRRCSAVSTRVVAASWARIPS